MLGFCEYYMFIMALKLKDNLIWYGTLVWRLTVGSSSRVLQDWEENIGTSKFWLYFFMPFLLFFMCFLFFLFLKLFHVFYICNSFLIFMHLFSFWDPVTFLRIFDFRSFSNKSQPYSLSLELHYFLLSIFCQKLWS